MTFQQLLFVGTGMASSLEARAFATRSLFSLIAKLERDLPRCLSLVAEDKVLTEEYVRIQVESRPS